VTIQSRVKNKNDYNLIQLKVKKKKKKVLNESIPHLCTVKHGYTVCHLFFRFYLTRKNTLCVINIEKKMRILN